MRTATFAFLVVAVGLFAAGCMPKAEDAWQASTGDEETFGPYRFTPPSGFESKKPPNVSNMPPGFISRAWVGPKKSPSEPTILVTFGPHELDLTEVEPNWEGGISNGISAFRQKCNSLSPISNRRLRVNGMEAMRGGFTGKMKDNVEVRAVFYILADDENIISLVAIDGGPKAASSVERLEEAILTFKRPGYEAPPSIATISQKVDEKTSLSEARRGFATQTMTRSFDPEPLPDPTQLFRKVQYESPVGKLGAYLTADPGDGKQHPAIVWITGGDCNSLSDVWSRQPDDNDQSASAYREAGIVMMFPTLRGGNENPGIREGFLGEVDDVLAAADYLAKQSCVDPGRIYLGGHSSGGTLVLLAAEYSDRFRAVFSFGPTDSIADYPRKYLPFDVTSTRELDLRSPILWLHSIKSPTFVFEGTGGNIESLKNMQNISKNDRVRFFIIQGEDHFTILSTINRLIAAKILADDGSTCNLSVTKAELTRQFISPHSGSFAGPRGLQRSRPFSAQHFSPDTPGMSDRADRMMQDIRARHGAGVLPGPDRFGNGETPAPAAPDEVANVPSTAPPEPDEFAGMSPQQAAVAMANAHDANNVARIVVRGVTGDEAKAKLRTELARMMNGITGAKIFVASTNDMLAAVVAPVPDLQAFSAKADFATKSHVDEARRMVSLIPDPLKWSALPITSEITDPRLKSILAVLSPSGEYHSDHEIRKALRSLRDVPVNETARPKVAAALVKIAKQTKQAETFQRKDAIILLSVWYTPEVMDDLAALAKHSEVFTRWEVYDTLGKIRGPRAAAICVEGLGGEDSSHASRALMAMGADAEDAVLEVLNTRNKESARAACDVLGKIGTKKCLSKLKRLAKSSDFFIRSSAESAIRGIQRR